jgi:CTP:molybdopterin cytidylyltransferase MocA
MMKSSSTACIILAAGGSTRLGLPKQLLQLEQKSLLRRACETALDLDVAEVVVVLGFEMDRMKRELNDLPVKVLPNQRWKEGIASSIRVGVEALPHSIDAAMVILCDQPFVPPAHLRRLIEACSVQTPIAATAYPNAPGVPACFARVVFPELLSLEGDAGAKRIIAHHRHEVAEFPCPEASIDIDTLADYQNHLNPLT